MQRQISLAVLVLALSACWSGANPDEQPTPTASASASATAPADSEPGGARDVTEQTDLFLFEYSYPKAAGDVVALAAWLDERLEKDRRELASSAARAQREARESGFPFNKYSTETRWEVIADLPDWISLSADLSVYTGGAHGNYGFDSVVWDKKNEIALEPIAFFTSLDKLDDVLNGPLCEKLNAERAKRRGMVIEEGTDDPFSACVKVDETNLLLGSRGGKAFDRIGVQIAPYIAGPFAEGSYEFSFDVTPELLETVRPEYREAFSARK